MEKAARDLRLALGETASRLSWSQALRLPGFADSLELLQSAVCIRSASRSRRRPSAPRASPRCARRAATALAGVVRMRETDPAGEVRWVEVFGHGARLHVTPLSSAELFSRQMNDHPRAWIFTSATLAMGEEFGHFTRELGLGQAATRRWASPFDFAQQALLYLPKGLPADPNDAAFTDAVVDAALPVIEASGGRAFLLFTTLRALRRAHERLRGMLSLSAARAGHRLAQRAAGALPRARQRGAARQPVVLGRRGRARRGAVGGGDRQAALRAARRPGARRAHRGDCARAGGNPFIELQLPQAVLQLKQGAGRLIRDETDRGVLMLCDPRLVSKAYGRQILRACRR